MNEISLPHNINKCANNRPVPSEAVGEGVDGQVNSVSLDCPNPACLEEKKKLRQAAPSCDFLNLREWALSALSCHIVTKENASIAGWAVGLCALFLSAQFTSNKNADHDSSELDTGSPVFSVSSLLEDILEPQFARVDFDFAGFERMSTLELFEVLDLFYWVAASSKSPDDPRAFELAAGTMGVLTVIQPKFGRIPKGVCLHRVWNAAKSSPRGLVEIVTLEAVLSNMSISDHHLNKHHSCTIQVCLENDEHTTNIPQLHMLCADAGSCPQMEFDVDRLNKLEKLDAGATAWDLSGKDPAVGAEIYVALSHVWSDGTGVGPKRTGSVNRCLVQFWKDIIGSTKDPCSAIWWDTVSLPTEREKRNKALSQMHANYNRAEWTLVHNRELADFTWQDDGSPCVALALSAWFSRGWTALEFLASKSVRVLFKDSAGNRLLKDLDSEILARVGDGSTHPAHRAVSAVIRRLRPRALETLPNVYASFEQLMSCMRSSWPMPTFIMKLLDKVKQVGHRGLMHNQTPMSEEGPWSWCPPSIFHLEDNFDQRDHQHDFSQAQRTPPLHLLNGELWGPWEVRRLWATDQTTLVPYAAHDYQFFRVQSALKSARGHFLLSTFDSKRSYERYVLVRWLDESSELSQQFSPDSYPKLAPLPKMLWKFRFVGTVVGSVNTAIDSFTLLAAVVLC